MHSYDMARQREEAEELRTNEMRDCLRGPLENILANDLLELQLSKQTLKCYKTELRKFSAFCTAGDLPSRPAAPEVVAHYVLDLGNGGVPLARINRALAAISYSHRIAQVFDPCGDHLVRAALNHVKRNRPQEPEGEESNGSQ
jgi:hypothetical protein